MKYDKEVTTYENYFVNVVIYFIAMFIGSFGAIVFRTLLSFFIRTPSLADLKADAGYLFDRVYPPEAVFTTLGFLAGGFFCCYYLAYRIGKKTGIEIDTFKMKAQLAPPAFLVSLANIGFAFIDGFTGFFGMQFWYPAAVLTRLFGGFKNTDLLGEATINDLTHNSFIPDSIAYSFVPLTIVFAVIECAAFIILAYYGRKLGMRRGVAVRNAYLAEVRGEKRP